MSERRQGTGSAAAQAPDLARRGAFQQPWRRTPGSFTMRIAAIAPFVAGRDVLDVGFASGFGRPDWMHAEIAKMARSTLGIDLDAERVAEIAGAGYNVESSSAESFATDHRFEVVFAGELIEHLECPASFLAMARSVLTSSGSLVLTTPNPFALANFLYRIKGRAMVNADHVAWYCEDTIRQLLAREGFAVTHLEYVGHPSVGSWPRRVIAGAIRRVLPPVLQWGTMLVVADQADSSRAEGR